MDRDLEPVPGTTLWRHPSTPRLFRLAYGRLRVCRCYHCIVLTSDERAYQSRVLSLARAWKRMLKREANRKN